MPLTPINGSAAQLRELTRKLRSSRKLTDVITSATAEGIITLAREQINTKRTPSGGRWIKPRQPWRSRPLGDLAGSLQLQQSYLKIRVSSYHPGAGYLNYGRGGQKITGVRKDKRSGELTATTQREQPPRPFLPVNDLPGAWKQRLLRWGMGDLAYYLGKARKGYVGTQRAIKRALGLTKRKGGR